MVVMGVGLVGTLIAEQAWVDEEAGAALRYVLMARGMLAGMLLLSAAMLFIARIAESAERSEQAARLLLDTVTSFLDELPIAAFVVSADGRPIYSNKASYRLLGKGIEDVSSDELAGTYQAFVRGTDDPYPAERMPILRALAGEQGATADDMEIRVGDEVHALQIWANPVRDENGRIRFAIAGFVEQGGTLVR